MFKLSLQHCERSCQLLYCRMQMYVLSIVAWPWRTPVIIAHASPWHASVFDNPTAVLGIKLRFQVALAVSSHMLPGVMNSYNARSFASATRLMRRACICACAIICNVMHMINRVACMCASALDYNDMHICKLKHAACMQEFTVCTASTNIHTNMCVLTRGVSQQKSAH